MAINTRPQDFSIQFDMQSTREFDSRQIPPDLPLILQGELIDGNRIALHTDGTYDFGTKPHQGRTWFVWRGDRGKEPTTYGEIQSWSGSTFEGEPSTEILGEGSAMSYRKNEVSPTGASSPSFLGQIDFASDEAYVFKRRYNDYDFREATTFRLPVNIENTPPEIGQIIVGQNGATGRFLELYEQDGQVRMLFDPIDPETTVNKRSDDPKFKQFDPGQLAMWTGGQATVVGTRAQQREHNNKNNRFWSNGNNNMYTQAGNPTWGGALTVTTEYTPTQAHYTPPGRHDFISKAWYDEQLVYKSSSLNSQNGSLLYYRDGVLGSPDLKLGNRNTDLPNPYSKYYMDQFTRRTLVGECWSYIDYVYFDNSHCRVLLATTNDLRLLDGEGIQTYKVIPLPVRAWSRNTIELVFMGLLPDWTHLFVVGSTNQVIASGSKEDILASPPVAGGSPETILWSAPDGLKKGSHLIVRTEVATAPKKFTWLGFGEGYISTLPEGKLVTTHTAGGETIEIESQARRLVALDETGNKHIRSVVQIPGVTGSGTIN